MTESLFCTAEIGTTLLNQLYFHKLKKKKKTGAWWRRMKVPGDDVQEVGRSQISGELPAGIIKFGFEV